MTIRPAVIAALAAALALTAGASAQAQAKKSRFSISSPSFKDDGWLKPKNGYGGDCGGGNLSPPLKWSHAPAGTKSFAIIMIDPDGRRGLGSVHWIAYDIPPQITEFKEGEASTPSSSFVGGKNSRGLTTYAGPCPPKGDAPHHYVIDVLALDLAPGSLAPGLDRDALVKSLEGHSLGPASIVARYAR